MGNSPRLMFEDLYVLNIFFISLEQKQTNNIFVPHTYQNKHSNLSWAAIWKKKWKSYISTTLYCKC